jgi:uncharacterized protein YlxW (UPF0749 family)
MSPPPTDPVESPTDGAESPTDGAESPTDGAESPRAGAVPPAGSVPAPRWRRLLRPRGGPAELLVAFLCALVGFALVVTVNVQRSPRSLDQASSEDLVRILADLTQRSDRLRTQIATLQAENDKLAGSGDRSAAAIEDAQRRAQMLGVLAGTVAATGPGITVTITDPQHTVPADALLDAVEELRDAGAEAMQIGTVRVVASTYLRDGARGVTVDGVEVRSPYRFVVIGDSHTLADALGIPGGVLDNLTQFAGARAVVSQSTSLTVDALKVPAVPRYAQPAATATTAP